jgi:hypothetical protein
MKLSNTAKFFAVCLCATLLLPAFAIADDDDKKSKKSKKTHYPIDLEIISPVPPKNKKSGKPKKVLIFIFVQMSSKKSLPSWRCQVKYLSSDFTP